MDVTKNLMQDEDGTPKEMIERRNAERRQEQRRKFYGDSYKHGLNRRGKLNGAQHQGYPGALPLGEPQDEANKSPVRGFVTKSLQFKESQTRLEWRLPRNSLYDAIICANNAGHTLPILSMGSDFCIVILTQDQANRLIQMRITLSKVA